MIMTAFILAGIVAGIYAIAFLKAGVKLNALMQERTLSSSVADFLRRMS